jgi:rhamnulokinase
VDGSTYVAVDVGASSGRVMLADVGPGRVVLHEAYRFANASVPLPDGLHWGAVGLFGEVLVGLRAAGRLAAALGLPAPSSIGIDTWAVDYGLLDADGALLGEPWCYRDGRNGAGVERVHTVVPFEGLYAVNGLQFLPFTTLYQLAAERSGVLERAATLLLLPDLLVYWLTGAVGAERTNASTTGLLDPRTGEWSGDVLELLTPVTGPVRDLLPQLRSPGQLLGTLLPHVAAETGLEPATRVVAVGSHDTASAVAAVPAENGRFAYVSCGTWSLVGLELDTPVLTPDSREANFTNEGGIGGRVRFLRNVMGLWLLQESLRVWEREDGAPLDLPALLAVAAGEPGGVVIDPDDPAFLPPGDMPARIGAACLAHGVRVPPTRAALVRLVLDSLANAYARAVADAVRLSGRDVEVVHLVGGGARNTLLCRLTARACGLPVVAGPVEATAIGNALVQAQADGVLPAGSGPMRSLVARSTSLHRFTP